MTEKRQENRESTWFGDRKVDPDEKTRLVENVFDSVAGNYDLMNDLMSGGIHRIWKNKFVQLMHPRAAKTLLDVAGGTGDIAFRYRAQAGEEAQITVCDINKEMLKVGKDRAIDRGYLNEIKWINGNAEKLPFEDSAFHLYSIAFGLRNVTHIDNALREAKRVLKPGGQFFCLEFSHIKSDLLKRLYDEYSARIIPKIGEAVAKDRESYQYLVESIRRFPPQGELAERIIAAGFDKAEVVNLSGGIAAIHIGTVY
jgi:demethylmenaquinone methyltransferase/2-methoxy-6-polyprenyl-1,4-benzoquinol methylase